MPLLRSLAQTLLPSRLRRVMQSAHRGIVFRRAMKQFLLAPAACSTPGNPILADLIYGWGNSSWSALEEYLAACIQYAMTSDGPILECGSGLSTLLVGAVAKRQGQRHVALEHHAAWARKVKRYLTRYQLDAVTLMDAPLKDYGEFCWYDASLEMPARFSLVICDGPPGTTKGGRYGLVPTLRSRLKPGTIILLDDAGRDEERDIAHRWQEELGAMVEYLGETKPYARVRV